MAGFDMRGPLRSAVKLMDQAGREGLPFRGGPGVPHVVGYPPQLRVLFEIVCLLDGSWTGGKAQDHWPPGLVDRGTNHVNLVRLVGLRDAVDLDVVDAPSCIQLDDGIVIGL